MSEKPHIPSLVSAGPFRDEEEARHFYDDLKTQADGVRDMVLKAQAWLKGADAMLGGIRTMYPGVEDRAKSDTEPRLTGRLRRDDGEDGGARAQTRVLANLMDASRLGTPVPDMDDESSGPYAETTVADAMNDADADSNATAQFNDGAEGETGRSTAGVVDDEEKPRGQDAVLRVLRDSPQAWLTVKNVADRMVHLGWAPDAEDPTGSVRTTLWRLWGDGDGPVERKHIDGRTLAYRAKLAEGAAMPD